MGWAAGLRGAGQSVLAVLLLNRTQLENAAHVLFSRNTSFFVAWQLSLPRGPVVPSRPCQGRGCVYGQGGQGSFFPQGACGPRPGQVWCP